MTTKTETIGQLIIKTISSNGGKSVTDIAVKRYSDIISQDNPLEDIDKALARESMAMLQASMDMYKKQHDILRNSPKKFKNSDLQAAFELAMINGYVIGKYIDKNKLLTKTFPDTIKEFNAENGSDL